MYPDPTSPAMADVDIAAFRVTPDAYPFQLGNYHFPSSTQNAEAALWFDRGMTWIFGFNHEEAVVCFRQAVLCDPEMAIAWWGIAYASGPFMNMPWSWFDEGELAIALPLCHTAIMRAHTLSQHHPTSPLEAAIIQAALPRYPDAAMVDLTILEGRERAYADAMLAAYQQMPDDPDMAMLYIDAQIMLTPWHMWDIATAQPNPVARTATVMAALDRALSGAGANHIGLLHYHIHVMEMSPTPEDALESAQRLRALAPPDTGHLHHMPAHILALTGDYGAAMECSALAVAADARYLAAGGAGVFYRTSICHDLHMQMFAGMQAGHYASAQSAVDDMTELLHQCLPYDGKRQMVATLEGYYSMRMHVAVRFGRWQTIIDTAPPEDTKTYPVSLAMHHYAQAVAHAALGDEKAADLSARAFDSACAAIPTGRFFFNNPALDTLGVAAAMMQGEMLYHRGEYDRAFAWLETAVERDDALFYNEPWAWMHPPRHALGALLLEQGHVERARDVYLADLGYDHVVPRCKRHANNIWALHGVHECLERLGDERASQFAAVLAEKTLLSDQQILASCCCRREKFI